MSETAKNEHLTVTLTDRAPARIRKADWPIVAKVEDWDNQHRSQANRDWTLIVRQHADGRALVYGIYSSRWADESDRRGGELVESGDDIPAAVKRVAEYLGFSRELADRCVAKLPAVDLI